MNNETSWYMGGHSVYIVIWSRDISNLYVLLSHTQLQLEPGLLWSEPVYEPVYEQELHGKWTILWGFLLNFVCTLPMDDIVEYGVCIALLCIHWMCSALIIVVGPKWNKWHTLGRCSFPLFCFALSDCWPISHSHIVSQYLKKVLNPNNFLMLF